MLVQSAEHLSAEHLSSDLMLSFHGHSFWLKRSGAFERVVYNSVHFIILNKSLGEGIGSICATRFFTKKVSVIIVPKGGNNAEILNVLYTYIVL